MLGRFRAARQGATAIEYALVAGSVALAIVAALQVTGTRLNAFITPLTAALR